MNSMIQQQQSLRKFNFLGHNLEIYCYDKDLLFLINFMTMIELHGSDYWNTFESINTYDGLSHLIIPIGIINHINSHIYVYDRDRTIDSVLL